MRDSEIKLSSWLSVMWLIEADDFCWSQPTNHVACLIYAPIKYLCRISQCLNFYYFLFSKKFYFKTRLFSWSFIYNWYPVGHLIQGNLEFCLSVRCKRSLNLVHWGYPRVWKVQMCFSRSNTNTNSNSILESIYLLIKQRWW